MTTVVEHPDHRRTHDTTTPRGWIATGSYQAEWAEKTTQKGRAQRAPDELTVPKSAVTKALRGIGLRADAEMTPENVAETFGLTAGTLSTLLANVLGEPDRTESAHRRFWLGYTVVERLMIAGYLDEEGQLTNLITGTPGRRAPDNRRVWDEKRRRWVTLLNLQQVATRLGVRYATVKRWPTPSCADMDPKWIDPYIVERGIPLYDEDEVIKFGKLPAGRWKIPRLDADGELMPFKTRGAKNS